MAKNKNWEANPNIELASELLKKISQEKQKLIAEKKTQKRQTLANDKRKRNFVYFKNILWVRIDDLFIVEKGITGIKNAISEKYPLVVTAVKN